MSETWISDTFKVKVLLRGVLNYIKELLIIVRCDNIVAMLLKKALSVRDA